MTNSPRVLVGSALAACLVLTACASGPRKGSNAATAGRFEAALTMKEEGNCEGAVPILTDLAQLGRGWELAQVNLADCLAQGGQIDKATEWLIVASESNEPRAQARLALAYLDGKGVEQDPAEAAKWYVLATRSTLGAFVADQEMPEGFEARMIQSLSGEDMAAGKARAARWIPDYQSVNSQAMEKHRKAQAEARRKEAQAAQRKNERRQQRGRY